MHVLILQNSPANRPALLGDFFTENNITFETVFAYRNSFSEKTFDALAVLGGPPNAMDDKNFPYLALERELILSSNKEGKRILGICLGAQLAAVALGGQSKPNGAEEFGWSKMNFIDDPVFEGVSPLFFEFHGDWITLPKKAELIGSNKGGVQSFKFENIVGVQFHPEVDLSLARTFASRLPYWQKHAWDAGKHLRYAQANPASIKENAFRLFANIFRI